MKPDELETCFKCGKKCKPSCAMNFGVGHICYCRDCMPPCSAEEAIEQLHRFIEPPKSGCDGQTWRKL